ncbi:MAG TPA: Fe(3+) ABC transporter substrate-binding protein, partial [Afifellaceae bacterium]|nr:Fe(3+) ABC transporter substrate-binding protein [Afifellaceae bacterium]
MTKLAALTAAAGVAALALVTASPAEAAAGRLVLYTSQPSEQMEAVLALFNEEHPDIEVEMFRSGTTEVMNKLA